MNFEGVDWTELSSCIGINENDFQTEEEILLKTKEYICSKMFLPEEEKEIANIIREFLRALYSRCIDSKPTAPLWKGLLEVEDNFTLIKYTAILLEHMWY